MKVLTLIFTAYIFALACMPCTDVGVCKNQGTESHNHANHQENQEEHQNEDGPETCPPFCVCACCGIPFSYHHFVISIPQPKETLPARVSHYKLADVAEVFFSIWQPPKLS